MERRKEVLTGVADTRLITPRTHSVLGTSFKLLAGVRDFILWIVSGD